MRNRIKAKKQGNLSLINYGKFYVLLAGLAITVIFYGCNSSAGSGLPAQATAPALPVITLASLPATTYQEFSASLEGTKDIEIRPQVDGYIEKIFVDEGAKVKKGQSLFVINDRPYREQLNNATASLAERAVAAHADFRGGGRDWATWLADL